MATEKLNLWDRLFNRKRQTINARGTESWTKVGWNGKIECSRDFVEYLITDRVTGSQKIVKKYLN